GTYAERSTASVTRSGGRMLGKAMGASNMSHAKKSSKPKRRNIVPVLGAAGLSLSLASGTSAATEGLAADILARNAGASHAVMLGEEEIFDVSLATFYVINKENAGTFQPGRQLAMAVEVAAEAALAGRAIMKRGRQKAMSICRTMRSNPRIRISGRTFQKAHRTYD